MSVWKRIPEQPSGVMPGGLITKIAVGATALLLGVMLLTYGLTGGQEESATVAVPEAAGFELQQRAQAAIDAETRRQEAALLQQAAAAERQLAALQEAAAAPGGGVPGIVPGAFDIEGPRTEAEAALLEALRLEDIERRRRSLRAEPVVLTYRTAAAAGTAAPRPAPGNTAIPDGRSGLAQGTGDPVTLEDSIGAAGDFLQLLAALEAEEAARNALPPPAAGAAPLGVPPLPAAPSSTVPVAQRPADPPDWARIYEGSFLESVLVTQLNGDFPAPVLANVSVPFYSADRQRVLIPRGARLIGTVQEVTGQDQERLAVSFHRLIWPDGRSVSLQFTGLNQAGEGALKDEVDRHYFSMFAAAGAVGILAGLTARGSNPYAGGQPGFQAGASQGLGQSSIQILDRFLNRLPTITIRAGHRLRIWFTSDVLVPPEA